MASFVIKSAMADLGWEPGRCAIGNGLSALLKFKYNRACEGQGECGSLADG